MTVNKKNAIHRKPLLTEAEDENIAFGGLFWIEMSSAAKHSQLVWESLSHIGTLNTGISFAICFFKKQVNC